MSNMPILSNNAAAASKTNTASSANTGLNDETSKNTPPFGEVLARQLSEKPSIDVKSLVIETQADAKPQDLIVSDIAIDVAIVAAVDPVKIESNVDIATSTLPTDMLATMMPQAVAAAVAAANIPTQPAVSDNKPASTSDKQPLTLNTTAITPSVSTDAISPKSMPIPLTRIGIAKTEDKLKVPTEGAESKGGEIAQKDTSKLTASKESAVAADTDRSRGTPETSELNTSMLTLRAAPATPSSKSSVSTTAPTKVLADKSELNAGMPTLKAMPSTSSNTEVIPASNKIRTATTSAELNENKIALNTRPTITASMSPAATAAPSKTGADVATFAKELELRDKLDIALAAPSNQTATPPANLVQSMTSITPTNIQATQLVIDTPVTQRQWSNDFSQKITWMATQQDQHAELHLNPAQLGPVDVVIKVSGDQATAQFTSTHAAVREVIEQSIPKLREMLADNGIMLGNTTVSDQAPREQRGEFGNQRQTAPSGRLMESAPANMSDTRVVTPLSRHNGMVDTFA